MTIVVVTHEQEIARFASRIITFRDGCVVSDQAHAAQDAQAQLADLDQLGAVA